MEISEVKTKKEFESTLPLINVVFLLLIFFMLAGSFKQPQALEITPPNSQNTKQANKNSIIISISADNKFAIADTHYELQDLLVFITQKFNNNKQQTSTPIVQLKADKNLQSKDLLNLMNSLAEAGLDSVYLLSQETQGQAL